MSCKVVQKLCIMMGARALLPLSLAPPSSCCPCRCNKKWIECHLEACRTHLGGKPLVLQEFNMPRRPPGGQADSLRLNYYDHVSGH
jgi:hypothetical protein